MLVSCDGFFSANVFKSAGLGQVSSSEIKTANTAALYSDAYTSSGTVSASFLSAVTSDEETKTAVISTLTADESSSDPTTSQQAAVLKADIQLQTTAAAETVSNLAGYLASATSLPSTSSDIAAFFKAVVPTDVQTDSTKLSAMVSALLTSAADYTVVEKSLEAGSSNATLGKSTYATVLQSAAVSIIMTKVTVGGSPATADQICTAIKSGDSSSLAFPTVDDINSSLSGLLSAGGYTSISALLGSSK